MLHYSIFIMSEQRKAVIKNADMEEKMQQDAVDIASKALSEYNIEKVCSDRAARTGVPINTRIIRLMPLSSLARYRMSLLTLKKSLTESTARLGKSFLFCFELVGGDDRFCRLLCLLHLLLYTTLD